VEDRNNKLMIGLLRLSVNFDRLTAVIPACTHAQQNDIAGDKMNSLKHMVCNDKFVFQRLRFVLTISGAT